MASIRAILFDKDGTLFDFQKTWATWAGGFLESLAEGDKAVLSALSDAVGFDFGSRQFRPGSPAVAGTTAEIADVIRSHLPDPPSRASLIRRMDDAATDLDLAEAVPLRALLGELNGRGLRLAVVTNDGEASARAHLDAAGVAGAFAFVAGYDSGFGAKPGPGQLLAACAHFGVRPEAAVMVGDSVHDLIAARAAGTLALGVLTGLEDASALAPHSDGLLPSIADLAAWLDARPA